MTRVLFVIDGLGTGGAQRSLAEMLGRFVDHGIDPTVVCFDHKEEGVEQKVIDDGYDLRVLDGAGPRRLFQLRREILEQKPEVVNTTLFTADVVGRAAAMGTGAQVLTSLVNTSYDSSRESDPNIDAWRLRVARMIDSWTARFLTHHFHAISETVRSHAVDRLGIPADRVTVIPRGRDRARLGVSSPDRRARVRKTLDIPCDAEVVLNVGRQEYQKGQLHLVDAAPTILSERPRSVVLVAGRQGHMTERLEDRIRQLNLGGRFRLLGHRDDIPDLLAAADVFAFPSLFEGLGGAVIEALAMGLPIVATDVPALREVIGSGDDLPGVFVPRGEAAPLAGAVVGILADEVRQVRMSEQALRRFETAYDLDRVSQSMADLFHRLGSGA